MSCLIKSPKNIDMYEKWTKRTPQVARKGVQWALHVPQLPQNPCLMSPVACLVSAQKLQPIHANKGYMLEINTELTLGLSVEFIAIYMRHQNNFLLYQKVTFTTLFRFRKWRSCFILGLDVLLQ